MITGATSAVEQRGSLLLLLLLLLLLRSFVACAGSVHPCCLAGTVPVLLYLQVKGAAAIAAGTAILW